MDEAGARARIGAMTRPPDVKEIEKEIEEIRGRKEAAIKAQDFEKAAALRDDENPKAREAHLIAAFESIRDDIEDAIDSLGRVISVDANLSNLGWHVIPLTP